MPEQLEVEYDFSRSTEYPYTYYEEGPFLCAKCDGEILRGEPHSQSYSKEKIVLHSHFCCQPSACKYHAYLIGELNPPPKASSGWRPCECIHVSNVGWWPCVLCGIAHGGCCPPADAPRPCWPPLGWRHPDQ